jgi:hypothetical protein
LCRQIASGHEVTDHRENQHDREEEPEFLGQNGLELIHDNLDLMKSSLEKFCVYFVASH